MATKYVQIKNEEELDKKIAECFGVFKGKLDGTAKYRTITICGGTGCLSSDSKAIIEEFEKEIKERKLEGKVKVNKVGFICINGFDFNSNEYELIDDKKLFEFKV